MKRIAFIAILLISILGGCWYYSFTNRPYPEIDSTYVESLGNETDRFDLSPLLTEGLINELHGSALLDVVGKDAAESRISGTVTSYERETHSYTSTEEPLEYIVRIRARVTFTAKKQNEKLWESSFEGFATYPADASTKDEPTAREEAVAMLVSRIMDRLRGG